MASLGTPCSRHFSYRDLIQCGDTFHQADVSNLPQNEQSWMALSCLVQHILDPVVDQFGELTLTFGFCSQELAKACKAFSKSKDKLPAIYPALDQHACHELSTKGEPVCSRGGAACDFIVPIYLR